MIYIIVLILIAIACIGIVLLRSTTNESRLFVFLPAGMLWGVSVYIFLLNLNSKLLPGQPGIILSTIILILLGIIACFLSYRKRARLERPHIIMLLAAFFLILSVVYLARLKMTAVLPVADSDMQWAYAASFARGNFPLKAPWQPDLNPNYHLGAYFLEGALLSLTKLPLITLHTILNTYFLIAGALFAIFIFWENKYSFRNLWLVTTASVLYISFGVILFISPGPSFLENIRTLSELLLSLTNFPTGIIAKGTAGASLVDLNSLSFLPARSLSLGFALLALYFSFVPFKSSKLKVLSFVLLLSTTALVEESMFLPLFATICAVFALSLFSFLPKLEYLKSHRKNLILIILITSILIIFQGGFFSDLFEQRSSTFLINLPYFSPSFLYRLEMLKSYSLPSGSTTFNWILLSPLLLITAILFYSYLTKKKALSLLGLFSLISFLCFLIIEYKYYPANNIRFFNFGYISSGVGFIYLLFTILQSKSLRINLLAFVVFGILMLMPTLLPELLNQSRQIALAKSQNIRSQVLISSNPKTPFEQISDWANNWLPLNSRLMVVDTDYPTPKRSLQFEYKGLYTILGPQNIRVLRQEPGQEFFDLALTLNPSLFRKTRAEYLYIESASPTYQQLPKFRQDELNNVKYFKVLKSIDDKDNFYRLYKIFPAFLDPTTGGKNITEGTLQTLQSLIPSNAGVYITDSGDLPKLAFWYRMAIILALKDKDIRRNLTQTDYMAIETNIPYKGGSAEERYDYYILGANQIPPYSSELIWSNIFATAWKRYQ